jgi:cyanophycinase
MSENPNVKKRHKAAKGRLMIIGGNERSDGEVLQVVATIVKRSRKPMVIIAASSSQPEKTEQAYVEVFSDLGIDNQDIRILHLDTREDALNEDNHKLLEDVRVVFFSGGDQLRLVHKIGDTPIFQMLNELYLDGGTLVGTSSGATAMAETMVSDGAGDQSPELTSLDMAPGFGFLDGVVVDSHFAERGRIGRLCAIVAQNSKNLGIGIDEDTAILVEDDGMFFRVIGSGAVYVVDGSEITFSSLSQDRRPEGILTIHDIQMHVLKTGDQYDLAERRPIVTKKMITGEANGDKQKQVADD